MDNPDASPEPEPLPVRLKREWDAIDADQAARKQQLLTQLQADWQELEAHLANQSHLSQLDADVRHAGLLGCARASGLTEREIAKAIKLGQQRVRQLLRYYRYLGFTTAVVKIPEFRFRQYWQQVRDPYSTRGKRKRENVDAYEQQVFAAIAAMVEAGKPPLRPAKKVKPKTAQEIRHATDPLKALRKEVRQIYYGELKGTLDKLEDLLGRDRSTYAPTVLANYAMSLKRTMGQILKLLADVDPDAGEEAVEALES
jgi:hypothetical protein